MAFQTGLSGLNAASQNLDVIGNNVSNSETVGFKSSRSEFAALVAASNGQSNPNDSGLGVAVAVTQQQFTQGTFNTTGNPLDLAINGGGFFQLTMPDGSTAYTRNGEFQLDSSGNIVTTTGAKLMGFPTTTKGVTTSTTMQALNLPTGAPIPASATTNITAQFNLNSSNNTVYNAVTNTPPYTTYGTSLNLYDSQGNAVPFTMNFTRAASTPASAGPPAVAAADNWTVRDSSGNPLKDTSNNPIVLSFNANGTLVAPATNPTISVASTSATAGNITATLDLSKATQYSTAFAVTNLTQDGYTAGTYVSLAIGPTGVITATYSNGQTQNTGMVALANFRNPQGLKDLGGNNWAQAYASGQPVTGQPGTGNLGAINSGNLENSNVDLTAELVSMMTAQRDYQANAQTIKSQDAVMQTLVNLG